MKGKVFLVGAGPGDPDLLTVRALRLLETADVVVYDRLISEAIMALVPPGVTRIPVGKAAGHHSVRQQDTNAMLVALARSGRLVVRLKGGDPFVFGRGGEEALHLVRHGVGFEVVPGITAALACTSYAGIPLTHRDASRGFRVVTGHLKEDGELELDWRALADPDCTLVVYMGLASLDRLAAGVIAAGLDGDTPAAAIQDGTTCEQRVVTGTLATLSARVEASAMTPPVLIVIGRTVALRSELNWFTPSGVDDESMAGWAGC
ncbi:MAG: uroporphyrinogen-III C-methyltransferase [Gammaproteobacteria bacterium]|nr:uroporphyrinogen-III C-methyltransferase [Gammaproteobacteria bacterium]